MDLRNTVETRRSVRTFNGLMVNAEDLEKMKEYVKTIENPYGIDVEFVFLDAEEHSLSSPVIKGEKLYVTAKIKDVKHAEEAYGYSFEMMVLYAWSLGLGTTWIGGTMNREHFEEETGLDAQEMMYCVTPLGYPARKMSIKEMAMRKGVGADKRVPAETIFFDVNFSTPLEESDEKIRFALEMVRLAPSAVNKQPWRIVRRENCYHFYLKHSKGYDNGKWDMQKIDMGIALCHFMQAAGGELVLDDPKIMTPEGTEYMATVRL